MAVQVKDNAIAEDGSKSFSDRVQIPEKVDAFEDHISRVFWKRVLPEFIKDDIFNAQAVVLTKILKEKLNYVVSKGILDYFVEICQQTVH